MHYARDHMDWSQMIPNLPVENIHARVRIANHHPVPAGKTWERSIPDLQLICFLEGLFEYQPADQPAVQLGPGDLLWIEPGVYHRLALNEASPPGEIAGFHFEFQPSGRWAAGDYRLAIQPERVTRLSDPAYLRERFCHLAVVFDSYRPYRQELVDTLATEIILMLAAHWQNKNERAAHPSPRMEAILAYIRKNLSQSLTRQRLAEEFNLSAGYINQLFKIQLGMSPSAVINRERAARAYQLLDREGLTVAESALAVGFDDPFYFSRVFKQIYTIPPSQVATHKFSVPVQASGEKSRI